MALPTQSDKIPVHRLRARLPKPVVVSGVLIPRGRFIGSRRFAEPLVGIEIEGPAFDMRLRLGAGPVRAVAVASIGGRVEAIGCGEDGAPLLLAGVMVGERPLFEFALEWHQTLPQKP